VEREALGPAKVKTSEQGNVGGKCKESGGGENPYVGGAGDGRLMYRNLRNEITFEM